MKKKLALLLTTAMLFSVVLAGCGGSASGGSNLTLATGGTSGTYYGFSGVVAQVLNEKLDGIQLTVTSTGASKANIQLIEDGDADMAIVQNDVMYYAYTGTDLFAEDGAITSFSAIGACYPEVCQIVSTTAITSIDQLVGMRVSVGDAGSGVEFNAKQILAAYGISFDDISVQNLSFADSSDALKDGKIDAFFCVAGAPTTAITELATTKDINLLSVDDAHADALTSEYAFYTQYTIEAGTYTGVDEDVQAVAVMATYIVSNDLDEDTVYQITKALFENKDEIAAGHAKGELLDPATAVSGIAIPFHSGAEKYFTEVGVL